MCSKKKRETVELPAKLVGSGELIVELIPEAKFFAFFILLSCIKKKEKNRKNALLTFMYSMPELKGKLIYPVQVMIYVAATLLYH